MTVKTCDIQEDSLIFHTNKGSEYSDCFTIKISTSQFLEIDDLVYRCFHTFKSKWVDFLFNIRNQLVKPFKLKVSPENRPSESDKLKIIKGGNVAFFEVKDKTSNEVLMFADDKHLSAYFCISFKQIENNATITASTTVQIQNRLGKYYFAVVKPFHCLIMKSMLKHVAKQYSI